MGMDRKEFCELMAKAKKESGIRSIDISRHFQMSPSYLCSFEKGVSSFSMAQAIEYLSFLGFQIVLAKPECRTAISDYSVFPKLLRQWRREKGQLSKNALSKEIGVSSTIFNVLERGDAVTGVDTFLKFVNYFGYTVAVEPHQKEFNHIFNKEDEDKFFQTIADIKPSSVIEEKIRRSPAEKRIIRIVESGERDFNLTVLIRYLNLYSGQICLAESDNFWLFDNTTDLIKWLNSKVEPMSIDYIATKIGVAKHSLMALRGQKKDMNIKVFLKLASYLGLSITVKRK